MGRVGWQEKEEEGGEADANNWIPGPPADVVWPGVLSGRPLEVHDPTPPPMLQPGGALASFDSKRPTTSQVKKKHADYSDARTRAGEGEGGVELETYRG